MNRSRWITAVVILAPCCVSADDLPQRLNVLFMVSDDLNTHLGCYGHSALHTPAIDRLAQRGIRFDRAYCQIPLCNPSRISFLSGLRHDRTGVLVNGVGTRAYLGDTTMLPELFRNNGYFTAQIGKIYHTGEGHEDPRSWDVEVREFGKRPPLEEILEYGKPTAPTPHTHDWATLRSEDKLTPDGFVARHAVEWLDYAAQQERPFFAAVGFRRPHAPYAAPQHYFSLYPRDRVPLPPSETFQPSTSILPAARNYWPPETPMTEDDHRQLIAGYYACNSFVDAQVGVVLDAVDRLGLWKNTVVVFFGDHGYHVGEHGGLWHKLSLFEESARVPLVVAAPGRKGAGYGCRALVELIDLYPTLVELAGLQAPHDLDGSSFSRLLDDPGREGKEAAFTVVARSEDPATHVKQVDYVGRSIRTDRWRYTEWDGGARGRELYDHEHDELELRNLADDPGHLAIRQQLERRLTRQFSPSRKPPHAP